MSLREWTMKSISLFWSRTSSSAVQSDFSLNLYRAVLRSLSAVVAIAWISKWWVGQCFFSMLTIWSVCTRARSERRVPTWKVSTVEEEVSMAVVEAMFAV